MATSNMHKNFGEDGLVVLETCLWTDITIPVLRCTVSGGVAEDFTEDYAGSSSLLC